MKEQGRHRDTAQNHAPSAALPHKTHTCPHTPENARPCSPCSAGRCRQPDSGEIGCGKYASDQIQPTASDLVSQSLWIPSPREAPQPPAAVLGTSSVPVWLCPESSVSSGPQLGGEGPGEGRPHPWALLPHHLVFQGPSTACTGDLLPRPGAALPPTHFSLAGLAWTYRWPGPGTPGPGGPSFDVDFPTWSRTSSPTPPFSLPPSRRCRPIAGLGLRLLVPDRSAHGYRAKSPGHLQGWPVANE